MNVFKESFGEIIFNEEVPCVIWKPSKFMNSDQFKKLMTTGIDFYIKKKPDVSNLVWLNDSRDMKVIGKEDQKWLEEFVTNQALKYGLKYIAFVLPENVFGKLIVNAYIKSTLDRKASELEIKTFSDYNKAVEWLSECARKPEIAVN
ncbi:MAG: hypothetical protein JXA77_06900 [Bacteroidales bacterium]|nr:hypothetical protein [Bacteroidales bacterium]MBN2819864.1 hypothetical protein [Bacteroidales bacterium]